MKINGLSIILLALACLWFPCQALAWGQSSPTQYQPTQEYNGPIDYQPSIYQNHADQYTVDRHGYPIVINGPISPRVVDRRTYEEQVRQNQPPYQVAPGVTFYPAPNVSGPISPRVVDRRTYEEQVRQNQPPYQVAPGVTFYPAPKRAQYDYYGNRYIHHGGRVYDQCSLGDRRAAAMLGVMTEAYVGNENSDNQLPGAVVGAAASAYIAGRMIGGNCL